MIHLSPAAARQINGALEDEAEELWLRVAARQSDDGQIEYAIGLDQPREGDLSLEEKGVPLLVGASSQALLANTQIDFVEYGPGDFRFIFIAAVCGVDHGELKPDAPSGACTSGRCGRCSPGT